MTSDSRDSEHVTDHDLERYHLGMIVEETELAALEEHVLACSACAVSSPSLAPSSADISFGIRPRGSGLTLTSIDYSKMSDLDKAKEFATTKRTDADYGLSWIRREGRRRVSLAPPRGNCAQIFRPVGPGPILGDQQRPTCVCSRGKDLHGEVSREVEPKKSCLPEALR
jgi:hypothetical protein